MPKVGIKRLTTGHSQKYRTQGHHSDGPVRQQELNAVPWIDCRQHGRVVADVHQTHQGKRGEPDHHDWPERRRHAGRAAALNPKQHDKDENGQRYYVVLKRGRGELETFDRGQHRNGRRYHGIADEHRSAHDTQRQQWPASPAQCPLPQRHQRQRAALPVVVGAQQQQDVFRCDDDEERPKNQRQNAKHDDSSDRLALRSPGDSLSKCIQR